MVKVVKMVNKSKVRKRVVGVLTPAELTEASDKLRKALVAHTGGANPTVEAYLETYAGFKRNAAKQHGMFRSLSARNMSLIEAQRGDRQLIGLYGGFRQWELLNRALLPDAKPLTIWVPSIKKVEDKKAVAVGSKADKIERCVGFSTAAVYDWSDTISLDPDFIEPSWESPLFAGDEDTLEALIEASSLPVTFKDLGGRSEVGHTDGEEIVIDTGSSAAPRLVGNLISTLAHELVHVELGHPGKLAAITDKVERDLARAGFEAEAALGEYLLLKSLGVDESVGAEITKAAADYLTIWSNEDGVAVDGHKGRMKLFNARLELSRISVDSIVSRILAGVDSTNVVTSNQELVEA